MLRTQNSGLLLCWQDN